MKRLLHLTALSMLALLILVPAAFAQGNDISCPPGSGANAAGTRCTDIATGLEVEPISQTLVNPESPLTNPCPELFTKAEDGRCVPVGFNPNAPAPAQEKGPANASSPSPPPGTFATLSFELRVECGPPADATFLGFIPAEGTIQTRLTDPDGDGVFTGSVDVPRFPPGPRPPGAEPVSLPVQIVQGPPTRVTALGPEFRVIRDFGLVRAEDRTFVASVSFCDDGGSVDGAEAKQLPATGGVSLLALGAGALLVGGGLLVRRLVR